LGGIPGVWSSNYLGNPHFLTGGSIPRPGLICELELAWELVDIRQPVFFCFVFFFCNQPVSERGGEGEININVSSRKKNVVFLEV